MKEISGDAQNIRALLSGAKYSIDYYQREYRWETKHVSELLDDLSQMFLDSYKTTHPRSEVENYNHYFLGSIIISDKDGKKFIVDGQQRLTSLTLLLIYLYRNLQDAEQKAQIAEMIFSQRFGARSFNLDVDERTACMDALFSARDFDEEGQSESVVNILRRFADIVELFPDTIGTEALPYFTDWLIENVYLVEITAYSDADAYTIFETMNDRGLSLTPADMLKGYLLANITDVGDRNEASKTWRQRVTELREIAKEEESDAIKAWLRSQHAQSIRERKQGAKPQDWDLIGTEFHRWVRDHEDRLGLVGGEAFTRFIQQDFAFYTKWYRRIRRAGETLTPGLEAIHYNAHNNFTLQYTALLAPLTGEDDEKTILKKLDAVSRFIDILIARRIWNWRAIDYSTMQYAMYLVVQDIRRKSLSDLVDALVVRLDQENETFTSNDRFDLNGGNRRLIHRMLARMTDYVETQSGMPSRYSDYVLRQGNQAYEVEHIWANHPERHTDEFEHASDFQAYRNRIGDLLLLPKSFNASYGDKTYAEKRDHYFGQNLLAQSLHDNAYTMNPGFKRFRDASGLAFEPHTQFKRSDLDARQHLYRNLAEQIWDPQQLIEIAASS